MESEGRSSTGSTVSGVFKTILQSPTPICMFYFSHPFGVSTPSFKDSQNVHINSKMSPCFTNTFKSRKHCRREKLDSISYPYEQSHTNGKIHSSNGKSVRLMPWPKNTWKQDFVLPPLIQFKSRRKDELASDLETILRTIRQAWNTPNTLTQLYTEKQQTVWKYLANHDHANKMGSGKNIPPPGSRLLKRRYSVPEIIMRKHELATQRPYDSYSTESVPSSKVIPSTGISNSQTSSSLMSHQKFGRSPGSDTNLSRTSDREISMRKTSLLRQMFGREMKRHKNSSPSSRHCRRVLSSDVECEECRKLNESQDNDDEPESMSSRGFSNGKLRNTRMVPSSETYSSLSDVSQPQSGQSRRESLESKPESYTVSRTSENFDDFHSKLKLEIEVSDNTQNSTTARETETSTSSEKESKDIGSTTAAEPDTESGSGDSALDVFISRMLIENLRDLAQEARQQCRRKQKESVHTEHETTTTTDMTENNSSTTDSKPTPSTCADMPREPVPLQRSKTDGSVLSQCSKLCNSSCHINLENTHSPAVVQINAGSTYPESESLMVSRNLKNFPRTESIEVQPSSASMVEDDNNCNNSDESLSLVDSLDGPIVEEDEMLEENVQPSEQPSSTSQDSQPIIEKSQAFFVPIVDSGQDSMSDIPIVSEVMPEKLKERIEQRQHELEARKESSKKYQSFSDEISKTPTDVSTICERLPDAPEKYEPIHHKPKKMKSGTKSVKSSKKLLQNDIGLLESYTVDSKGNLQFRPPEKPKSTLKLPNYSKGKFIRKQAIVTTRPPKQSKSSSSSRSSKISKAPPRDIQKMTIFQAQSDIITPDIENGPRRIYQKTEIQDGEKRIEILEIVECLESSADDSPIRYRKPKSNIKSACVRRSKIPVPICKVGRSAGAQKPPRVRESPSPRMSCGYAQNKVDQAIAELLVNALNRPEQSVIEVLRSPKEILPPSHHKGCRGSIISRRSTPKRSANSGKYRQIFEVIPEEKSSFSIDSSNEESSSVEKRVSIQLNTSDSVTPSTSLVKSKISTTTITTTTAADTTTTSKTSSRYKESVDDAEAKAWIGFSRSQKGSSVEEDEQTTQPYPSSETATSNQQTISSPSTLTAVAGSTTPKKLSPITCPASSESDNILKVIERTIPDSDGSGMNDHEEQRGKTSTVTHDCRNNCSKVVHERYQHQNCKNVDITPVCSKTEADGGNYENCQNRSTVDIWRVQSPDICKHAIPKTKASCQMQCALEPDTEVDCDSFRTKLATPPVINKCPADVDTEIDSRSFIICSGGQTTNSSTRIETSTTSNFGHIECKSDSLNKCAMCCFCNPELHKSPEATSTSECVYCNRKRTPQKKEEETNTEPDFFRTHDFYQSMSIRDHTHTMSRDSDTVSTKCTKTNEKIRRYLPENANCSTSTNDNKEKTRKNITRPKNINNLPKNERKSVNKIVHDNVKKLSPPKKKFERTEPKFERFPSPFKNQDSNYSYGRSTSPSSSSDSTCPTSPERRIPFPKFKCKNIHVRAKKGKKASPEIKTTKPDTSNTGSNSTNTTAIAGQNQTGWTVTLAGSCTQGPAPDVEMRLSFPKEHVSTAPNPVVAIAPNNNPPPNNATMYRDYTPDRNSNNPRRNQPILPPAIDRDSRRLLVSNASGSGGTGQRDINFPEVSNSPRNQIMPRQMTTKKAFRHLECNVAVTSATRTVSSFARGKRTMSYQALNTQNNRERQMRDTSLDLGVLAARRLSLESPLESMALTIMGNAIAPEQKPRVPTMSEKDLTGRHTRCFTRNRAFFT